MQLRIQHHAIIAPRPLERDQAILHIPDDLLNRSFKGIAITATAGVFIGDGLGGLYSKEVYTLGIRTPHPPCGHLLLGGEGKYSVL